MALALEEARGVVAWFEAELSLQYAALGSVVWVRVCVRVTVGLAVELAVKLAAEVTAVWTARVTVRAWLIVAHRSEG